MITHYELHSSSHPALYHLRYVDLPTTATIDVRLPTSLMGGDSDAMRFFDPSMPMSFAVVEIGINGMRLFKRVGLTLHSQRLGRS